MLTQRTQVFVKTLRNVRFLSELSNPVPRYPKVVDAETAVSIIESDQRIFFHSAAAFPEHLSKATKSLVGKVKNVEVCSIHTEGYSFHNQPEAVGTFKPNSFFLGKEQRKAVAEGRGAWIPIFLSEIPRLFSEKILPLDVALITVSPPDKHGYCSLGVSVDVTLSAVKHAKKVIAQVNKNMPRTHGDGIIHVSHLTYLVEKDEPLSMLKPPKLTPDIVTIGKNIASLIEDGATLQMGIGGIPDATLSFLGDRKRLGVHTEMFSEGIIDLVNKGVITNEEKTVRPGHIVGSFLMGTPRLFEFVDDNPLVHMYPSEYVNDPSVIKLNPKVVAINSAIEVDITGQVCADSIGQAIFSGTGGQVDFERGAALSKGGRPIIALPSRTEKGTPRIVFDLKRGAGVTTTRSHCHWIITEYGKVNVWGKNLTQRAKLLISVAHPDDRKNLTDLAAKRYGSAFLHHDI
jgi:4-hydroxybutyrate CoA-transferase